MKIKYLTIFFLLFIASCRKDYVVHLSPAAPKLSFAKNYKKDVSLRVSDVRKNKEFIGFRSPANVWKFEDKYKNADYFDGYKQGENYKIFSITNNQNLAEIVYQKFLVNLNRKGFNEERFSTNKVKAEVMEVSLLTNFYRNKITSKIKIMADTGMTHFEKIYDYQIISYKPMRNVLLLGPVDPGLSNDYYDEIINECLDENIAKILKDEKIWSLF